jgi:hypothetical protein
MKNLIILFLLLFTSTLYAQEFEGGLLGGFTGSQIDGDTYGGYNKLGLTAGAWVRRNMKNKQSWQLEIKYINKGASNNYTSLKQVYYKVALSYIEIPVFFQYHFYKVYSAEFGLASAYIFSGKIDGDGSGYKDPVTPFNQFDYSGLIGLNYYVTKTICVNMRFSYSLIPIIKLQSTIRPNYFLDKGQYNNLLCLSVYYQIK